MTDAQKAQQMLVAVVKAILETIEENEPDGTPSGIVYAALSAHGISYDMYQQIITSMKRQELIYEGRQSELHRIRCMLD